MGKHMDLVTLASELATPALVAKIAGLVGASPDQTGKGLRAAVPAVLAGILGAAGKPDATAALGTALAGAGGLGDLLDHDPALAASTGTEMLAPILGGGVAGPLDAALAAHAGLSGPAAGTLIGLAGAMALGTLGQAAGTKGLDAAGVLGLVQGEKAAIAAALPADLARALGGTSAAEGLDPPKPAPSRPKIDLLQPAAPPPPSGRLGQLKWLAGLLLLAAAVWFVLRIFGPEPEIAAVVPVTTTAAPAADPLMAGPIDVGAKMEAALDQVLAAFSEIDDANSAKIALPKLVAAHDSLTALEDPVDLLHEDGHTALKGIIDARIPSIDQGADRLLTDPNVAAEVKPIIDDILAELTAFSA